MATGALAARLWHRVHAKCWSLVGPMLNFSHHTSVAGQPWEQQPNVDGLDGEDPKKLLNLTEEEMPAAAPGYVSTEYLLLVDRICHAAKVPPGMVDLALLERAARRSFGVDQSLVDLGTFVLRLWPPADLLAD